MKTTKTISISQARERLAEITQEVSTSNSEYDIVRHGIVIAKIVPPNETTKVSPTFQKNLDAIITQYHTDLEELAQS
jgi:antitoxin (DNA-binding transcriptional repressor) of toxin-antitoxin stability system